MQGAFDDALDDYAASRAPLLCLFLRRRAAVLVASEARRGGAGGAHRDATTLAPDSEVAHLLPVVGDCARRADADPPARVAQRAHVVRPDALASGGRGAGTRLVRRRWLALPVRRH